MKIRFILLVSICTLQAVSAQKIIDPILAQMIADSCPQCIIGDSLTAEAQTITELELTQPLEGSTIEMDDGLKYFSSLQTLKLNVFDIFFTNDALPSHLKSFSFKDMDEDQTFLSSLSFPDGLIYLHLDGIMSEGSPPFPKSLKQLEFGSVGDNGIFFYCLPFGLEVCRNLVQQQLIIPNKPAGCTFEGNFAVNQHPYYSYCSDNNVRINLYVFIDENCNGLKESNEEFSEYYIFFVRPLGITLTYADTFFYADTSQTLQFQLLTNDEYKIFPNGEDFIHITNSSIQSTENVYIPLCKRGPYKSAIKGNFYFDRNKNFTKDPGEMNVPNVKLLATPSNILITSDNDGRFIYSDDTSSTVSFDLALPTNVTYWLPQGQIQATLPAMVYDTLDIGGIPLWKHQKDYEATIDLVNIGSIAKNTHKFHKTTLSNIGLNDLIGTVRWTINNWGFNNFYDFNITPDEIIQSGKDFTLIFRNFEIKSDQTRDLYFFASLIQETGTEISETVSFQANPTIDIQDAIAYTIGAPHDPNFIEVDKDRISKRFIQSVDKLNYTIHFQNIGTAPAKDVTVYNYISSQVDPDQFKITGISDIPDLKILNVGSDQYLLIWTFNNINLPPLSQDSMNSIGYVSYQIGIDNTIAPRNVIASRAEIVFDTENPIHTNIAKTRYYCPQMDSISFAYPVVDFFQCVDDEASFTVNYDSTFLPLIGKWQDQNESGLSPRYFTQAGDYTYLLTDEALCTESYQIRLTKPDSITFISEQTDSLIHIIVSGGTRPYTITWDKDNASGEFYWVKENGRYQFTITDFNGCEQEGFVDVNALSNNTQQHSDLQIYPQPANDILNLTFPGRAKYRYSIINSYGQSAIKNNSNDEGYIDISHLSSGTYILIVTQGKRNYISKFIKQ